MSVVIHWFRRDLRLTDNTALNAAFREKKQVIAVYVLSEWKSQHHWCGAARQEFLCSCLASLAAEIEKRGGRLIIRKGVADAVLRELVVESKADAIFYNRDPDPFGRAMEARVEKMAVATGVRVTGFKDHVMHEESEVLTGKGTPFKVYTPYGKAWSQLPKIAPENVRGEFAQTNLKSLPLPMLKTWELESTIAEPLAGGEAAAQKRLALFLDGRIQSYKEKRDFAAVEGTSRLSQDLRFGTLSIREIFQKCQQILLRTKDAGGRLGITTYVKELIWREFSFSVLGHWPDVLEHEFQEQYRTLPWRARWRPEDETAWSREPDSKVDFDRWCAGLTGFPIVDAGMRELNATGFMHNRVRMIVAMFLTKDLHIWWMHGESYFMQRLVDGEISSNNNGWQWSASTGTDAAPYFRIQNPWAQTARFDANGEYIKRWIPELRDVEPKAFCEPPFPGTSLAKGYPPPMVDHREQRDATISMFKNTALGVVSARPAKAPKQLFFGE